ncbi:alpha/beta hydrolase fold domain-containing protein [Mycolicibacterium austroafricanum]|uniref:alpha/beta hydrolase fold domain-containing protein n=1 Tax=Mycolicibacterium austroafricanum TaxID=39687 RepID=UPI001F3402BB|nr:alpha/beta hydrolase fold domain-containing protein [Mycolicibacterium austroafricanum]
MAVATGIGAAVLMGLGGGVAAADDTGGAGTASSQGEAGPARDDDTTDTAATDPGEATDEPAPDESVGDEPGAAEPAPDESVEVGADIAPDEVVEDEDDEASGYSETITTVVDSDPAEPDPPADTEPEPAPAVAAQLAVTGAARRDTHTETTAPATDETDETDETVYTAPPSFFDQVTVVGLRVLRGFSSLVGIDVYGLIGQALESPNPPWFVKYGLDVRRTEYEVSEDNLWRVWEFHPPNPTGNTVIAVHGGGFILEPLVTHWLDYAAMARDTGATVIVPMYPLATTAAGTAVKVVPAMARFISGQIALHGAGNVGIYADSAGSALAMAAVRELVLDGSPVPASMVLLSLAPDSSLSNPDIYDVDDPIINVRNLDFYTAVNHWSDGLDPQDPTVSPLFFEDAVLAALPRTTLYVGELEWALPDTLLLHAKWSAAGGAVSTVIGRGQVHDWALGGIAANSQAPKVRPDIYRRLGLDDVASGPRTITTGPPSFGDTFIVGLLRTLRWINEETGIKILSGIAGGSTSIAPPPQLVRGLAVTERTYNGWTVWELASRDPSGEYVVALHGGGFEAEATVLHWSDYAQMARETGATVLVPIYPMAPPKSTGTAATLVPPMADYLKMLIDAHGVDNVSLYGDSSGGSYAVLAVQEMLRRCRIDVRCVVSEAQPSRMVLVSPALHLTLRGPQIDAIDDPILPRPAPGERPRWNGDWDIDDPRVNPIAGVDLTGLPPTTVYIGTVEKLLPGVIAFRDKVLSQDPQADLTVVIGDGQLHGWALGGIVVNSQAPIWRANVYRQLGLSAISA